MIALYLLYGIAVLLPWNVYSKAIPYFQSTLPSYSSVLPGMASFSFHGSNLTALLLLILFPIQRYSLKWSVLGALPSVLIFGAGIFGTVLALPPLPSVRHHIVWVNHGCASSILIRTPLASRGCCSLVSSGTSHCRIGCQYKHHPLGLQQR